MHKEMMNGDMAQCRKMMSGKMLILGVLVLINFYFVGLNWAVFTGAILVLAGLGNLIMPGCCGKHHRRR